HPTTREHIWAKWSRKYIEMPLKKHSSGTAIINADRSVTRTNKVWGGDPRQRGLQIVCKRCNEGWMSDLQKASKPVLIPLIAGKKCILDQKRQTLASAWAAMTIICAEYFQPKNAAISVVARRSLYKTRTAPSSLRIWIGDYGRGDWRPHWGHNSLRITEHEGPQGWTVHPDGTPRSNTQVTTFVAGRLFIQVFSCPFAEILNAQRVTEAIDARLVQIWPIRTQLIVWPPSPAL